VENIKTLAELATYNTETALRKLVNIIKYSNSDY